MDQQKKAELKKDDDINDHFGVNEEEEWRADTHVGWTTLVGAMTLCLPVGLS